MSKFVKSIVVTVALSTLMSTEVSALTVSTDTPVETAEQDIPDSDIPSDEALVNETIANINFNDPKGIAKLNAYFETTNTPDGLVIEKCKAPNLKSIVITGNCGKPIRFADGSLDLERLTDLSISSDTPIALMKGCLSNASSLVSLKIVGRVTVKEGAVISGPNKLYVDIRNSDYSAVKPVNIIEPNAILAMGGASYNLEGCKIGFMGVSAREAFTLGLKNCEVEYSAFINSNVTYVRIGSGVILNSYAFSNCSQAEVIFTAMDKYDAKASLDAYGTLRAVQTNSLCGVKSISPIYGSVYFHSKAVEPDKVKDLVFLNSDEFGSMNGISTKEVTTLDPLKTVSGNSQEGLAYNLDSNTITGFYGIIDDGIDLRLDSKYNLFKLGDTFRLYALDGGYCKLKGLSSKFKTLPSFFSTGLNIENTEYFSDIKTFNTSCLGSYIPTQSKGDLHPEVIYPYAFTSSGIKLSTIDFSHTKYLGANALADVKPNIDSDEDVFISLPKAEYIDYQPELSGHKVAIALPNINTKLQIASSAKDMTFIVPTEEMKSKLLFMHPDLTDVRVIPTRHVVYKDGDTVIQEYYEYIKGEQDDLTPNKIGSSENRWTNKGTPENPIYVPSETVSTSSPSEEKPSGTGDTSNLLGLGVLAGISAILIKKIKRGDR